jgi:hypothetical protein
MLDSPNTPPNANRLLPTHHAERLPAPPEVWDWHAYESWRDTAWRLMADVLDDRVRAEFLRRPPEYVVGDDLSWLDRIIKRTTGAEIDSKSLMADRLTGHFTAMRACHATRSADLAAYYSDGLRPLDPEVVHIRAREIFLGGEFTELTDAHLEEAIKTVGSDLREGRVYFEANERLLIEDAGHYLLYGGEYLIAIAAHLPRYRDYRQTLKRFGTPTMFVCDVPLTDIDGRIVLEFAGTALEMMFQELLDGEDFEPDWHRGAGFCIHRPLPPTNIVGHYHPTKMRDPLTRY